MAGNSGIWREVIEEVISAKRNTIHAISRFLWENPESSYKEVKAHEYLTNLLESERFEVERRFVADTGFRAVFTYNGPIVGSGEVGDDRLPHICFLCEYDSTEQVGHAAGHNLKCAASIAAALSIKECLQRKIFRGKVSLLGTPGEDCGSGTKIKMASHGIFSSMDCCLMLAPLNMNLVFPKFYTLLVVKVSYKGKAAHASAFPWEGRNALDAAVACYNNIGLLRQQLKPTWSINGVIRHGGVQPNVIPEYTELMFWLRAPNHADLVLIQQKCTACFVAAAKATGCEADFHFEDTPYYPMEHNRKLGEIYKEQAMSLGMSFNETHAAQEMHIGSTDFGNVSQVVPCILPAFNIGKKVHIHSADFHTVSGTEEAVDNAITAAKALALTAAEVMSSKSVLEAVRLEYEELHGRRTSAVLQRIMSQE